MNERSTQLNAFFTTLDPFVSSPHYQTSSYRLLHLSSSLLIDVLLSSSFIVVSHRRSLLRRPLLASFALPIVSPKRIAWFLFPGFVVSPHRRLRFIQRPLSSTSSSSHRTSRQRNRFRCSRHRRIRVESIRSRRLRPASIARYVSIVITQSYRCRFRR